MDKSKIKSFAIWGKENLIKEMKNKINLFQEKNLLNITQERMEEAAYNWFYRFIVLRFMEVNDYLATPVKLFSTNIENNQYNLKEYKKIIIDQCNNLSEVMPEAFEKVLEDEEFLLPDNLLGEDSIVKKLVNFIDEKEFKEVEIIGWMHQYYISDKRQEIFEDLKNNIKISKEKISTATQLFTPKWIVKYMVENSLGELWLDNCSNKELQSKWKYYIYDNLNKNFSNGLKINPEDIKMLDPCMGSGNILIYVFEVLYDIYISCGYSKKEIPRIILEKNIYGLDIDVRVKKIACFSLIMQARKYNTNFLKEIKDNPINLNLLCIVESNHISEEIIKYFCDDCLKNDRQAYNRKIELRKNLECLIQTFRDGKEYGALVEVKNIDFKLLEEQIQKIKNIETRNEELKLKKIILTEFPKYIKQGKIISKKYDVTITNPPYMGNKGINDKLKTYIGKKFPNVNSDLFSVFIERNYNYTKENGYLAFMTPFVWMFISSYKDLREKMIKDKTITSLVQLQYSGFEDATVPVCTFTLKNCKVNDKGRFIRLCDFKGSENQPIKVLEAIKNPNIHYRYCVNSEDFLNIPGYPIAYWVTEKIRRIFLKEKIKEYVYSCTGMQTGDNNKFTRYWYEVDVNKINIFNKNNKCKWYIYNEGGSLVKWYGNHLSVVNWENDGEKIRKNKGAVIRNKKYYFNEGITWKRIGSSRIGLRYLPKGFIFDQSGDCMFPVDKDNLKYFLAYFNSKVAEEFFKVLSPTMNLTPGNINDFPIIFPKSIDIKERINNLVSECINIAKLNWDSSEISWDFKIHPLIIHKNNEETIEQSFNNWSNFVCKQVLKLKKNEEELNRIFIELYNLKQELTPDVELEELTMKEVNLKHGIKTFISYVVGCIFGRYSIDYNELTYIKKKYSIYENKLMLEKNNFNHEFKSSDIVIITDEEYLEEDVVSKFIEFVELIYGKEFIEENLEFIANSLGKKSKETSRQTIRRYFLKEFYKDHIKTYKRRPIYWLFQSGKQGGFNALMYMHNYNELTITRIKNDYLKIIQDKYKDETKKIQSLLKEKECLSREKILYKKKFEKIKKQLNESNIYDMALFHIMNKRISIDLDDGIKINYNKFQEIKFTIENNRKNKIDLLAKI